MMIEKSSATISTEPRCVRGWNEWEFMTTPWLSGDFFVSQDEPCREHGVGRRGDGGTCAHRPHGDLQLFRVVAGLEAARGIARRENDRRPSDRVPRENKGLDPFEHRVPDSTRLAIDRFPCGIVAVDHCGSPYRKCDLRIIVLSQIGGLPHILGETLQAQPGLKLHLVVV